MTSLLPYRSLETISLRCLYVKTLECDSLSFNKCSEHFVFTFELLVSRCFLDQIAFSCKQIFRFKAEGEEICIAHLPADDCSMGVVCNRLR